MFQGEGKIMFSVGNAAKTRASRSRGLNKSLSSLCNLNFSGVGRCFCLGLVWAWPASPNEMESLGTARHCIRNDEYD